MNFKQNERKDALWCGEGGLQRGWGGCLGDWGVACGCVGGWGLLGGGEG